MQQNGLHINKKDIFYGDFQKNTATKLSKQIINGEVQMPAAVVCTSDIMAITLCKMLTKNGVRILEDILVTGFDGSVGAITSNPSITTASSKDFLLGRMAMCRLYEKITGKKYELSDKKLTLQFGASYGCSEYSKNSEAVQQYVDALLKTIRERKRYMLMNHIGRLTNAETIDDLFHQVDNLAFML